MEFNNIYLLKGIFNYFNRKIYFYESLEDYLDLAEDYEVKQEVNFNPNEGVNTSLIVSLDSAVNYFEYCYLLVTDKDGDIISRWYIKDATRNLSGQFTLTLRRDVVAESFASFDFVNKAPIYVEKGELQDGDPLIVNDEGMLFNQIKKSEKLLKDRSGWGYIVGYMANSASLPEKTINIGTNATPSQYTNLAVISLQTGIDGLDLSALFAGGSITFANSPLNLVFGVDDYLLPAINHFAAYIDIPQNLEGNIEQYGANSVFAWSHAVGKIPSNGELLSRDTLPRLNNYIQSNYTSLKTALNSLLGALTPAEKYYSTKQLEKLEEYQGKIVYYNGQYFTMNFSRSNSSKHSEVVIAEGASTFFDNAMASLQLSEYYPLWELYLNYDIIGTTVELIPYDVGAFKYQISGSHKVLKDAPYSMFVIPYGDNIALRGQGNVPFTPSELMKKEEA